MTNRTSPLLFVAVVVITILFSSHHVASQNQSNSSGQYSILDTPFNAVVPNSLQCLAYTQDGATSDLEDDDAEIKATGCYSPQRVGLGQFTNMTNVTTLKYPSDGDKRRCAMECQFNFSMQMIEIAEDKEDDDDDSSSDDDEKKNKVESIKSIEFVVGRGPGEEGIGGPCYCIAPEDTTSKDPSDDKDEYHPVHVYSSCVGRSVVRVYKFTTDNPCPLNASQCTAKPFDDMGCKLMVDRKGCCGKEQSSGSMIPSYYRQMVQYVALSIIVLAVLEGIVYTYLRRRFSRGRFGVQGELETELTRVQRTSEEVEELVARLMTSFPAGGSSKPTGGALQVPTREGGPTTTEEEESPTCVICLDDMVHDDEPRNNNERESATANSKGSKVLPCSHALHAACLKDYLTHQLAKSNEATCPMCRATIVTENGGVVEACVSVNPIPQQQTTTNHNTGVAGVSVPSAPTTTSSPPQLGPNSNSSNAPPTTIAPPQRPPPPINDELI